MLAVPTLAPMAVLITALVKPRSSVVTAIAMPLLFILFLLASIVFLPYMLLLKALGKAGLVRLAMPPSCTVIDEQPRFCRLIIQVPHDDRATAAAMLTGIAERVAAAANADAEEARREIERLAATIEYGMSEELRLTFGDAATMSAVVYVEQGHFNAEVNVEGDEACVAAACKK